jgi:hypothetical protein
MRRADISRVSQGLRSPRAWPPFSCRYKVSLKFRFLNRNDSANFVSGSQIFSFFRCADVDVDTSGRSLLENVPEEKNRLPSHFYHCISDCLRMQIHERSPFARVPEKKKYCECRAATQMGTDVGMY